MDCKATFYSSAMFFLERCSFSCKILFFLVFFGFLEAFRVRFASMTNTKPSGGVVSLLP